MAEEEPRKLLPDELLSNNVVHLTCESSAKSGLCDVYLIGTCHISKESCREVQDIISFLKPQVVFLELCRSRASVLEPPPPDNNQGVLMNVSSKVSATITAHRERLVNQIIEKNKADTFWMLSSLLNAKRSAKLETQHGHEFYVASEEVKKYGGKVVLGDRPIKVTQQRAWVKLPLEQKLELIHTLLSNLSSPVNPEDLNKMIDKVKQYDYKSKATCDKFPTYEEIVVDERDQYISYTLHEVASEHTLVVAVVGKAHLCGIEKYWKQPIEMEKLMQIPD